MPKFNKPSMPRPQMEVYTASHGKSWAYNALPSPMTSVYSMVMAGSITGLAYFVGDKWFDGQGMYWSMAAMGVMTLLGLIIYAFRARRAKREQEGRGEGFESALRGSAAGWDASVNDPAEIARLDDLRTNFQKGVQTFREFGKDLYSLPWYVIVGEPGSGKTEAIRRSELRFPDMLQDKLQGTGGTYSMNWWFTNHAVILDTAGAMLMQPEATARFEEFLALLRAHRPACPINGMILTIPTDSLLADPPAVAEQKARTIAAQLAIIQKALDVRFPIYLMISKSDRLPGFREFFDAEGQASFERQMMGWSNPDPLGTPFAPEKIHEAIDTIAWRLQSRALTLLSDPVPSNPSARRMDETDAIYSFPQGLRTLAPRLKLYLNVIFQTGTWAAKPPFFRGVYFTSALREGAELDQQLAQALGMPLNQLPPGGFFAREKAVFLRDFFMEKVFHESGLVTRLFDVGAHLRKRLTSFYGATAALLLLALGFAWLVKNRINEQLHDDQVVWEAANGSWNNGTFLPAVTRSAAYSEQIPDRPSWSWTWTQAGSGKRSDALANLEQLQQIRQRVDEKIGLAWVYQPVPEWREFLGRRREGYLTVFEGSVMKPLLDAVRERILWDTALGNTTSQQTLEKLAAAYQQLLQLEVWLKAGPAPGEDAWNKWFTTLLAYLLDPAVPGGLPADAAVREPGRLPDKLEIVTMAQLASEAYSRAELRKRAWLSEVVSGASPPTLAAGSNFLLGISGNVAQSRDKEREILENLATAARSFLAAEDELDRIQVKQENAPFSRIERLLGSLTDSASRIETAKPLGGAAAALSQFQTILKAIEKLAGELQNENAFFADLQQRSADLLAGKTQDTSNQQLPPELVENVLKDASYRTRLKLYKDAVDANRRSRVNQSLNRGSLIGKLRNQMESALQPAQPPPASQPKPPAYAGPRADVCERIAGQLIPSYNTAEAVDQLLQGYVNAVVAELPNLLKFPLVADATREFTENDSLIEQCANLAKISQDLDAFDERKLDLKPGSGYNSLSDLSGKVRRLVKVSRSLYDPASHSIRKIVVNPSKPAEFKEEQPPPQPPAAPSAVPAAVPVAPVLPKIIPGLKELLIETSDGQRLAETPSNVSPTPVPCDLGIRIAYVFGAAADRMERYSVTKYNSRWGIVKAVRENGRVLRTDKLTVTFEFTPDLPSRNEWATMKDFVLYLDQAPTR